MTLRTNLKGWHTYITYELLKKYIWTSYEYLWTYNKIHMNFLRSTYKLHMNTYELIINTYELLMNFNWCTVFITMTELWPIYFRHSFAWVGSDCIQINLSNYGTDTALWYKYIDVHCNRFVLFQYVVHENVKWMQLKVQISYCDMTCLD